MNERQPRMSGDVAIVTGASSGIGRAVAVRLVQEGAIVVAAARRKEALDQLAADNKGILAVVCDVTDEESCRSLVARTVEAFGRIDVLINNAGASNIVRAEEEQPDDFRRTLEVNLIAPFTLAHLVAPTMIVQGSGSIVNIASIVGLVGLGRMPQASYAASKGGLINLTRELAAQWARKGIRVNAVAPGWFPTELTDELFDNEKGRDWVNRLVPMGRHGELSELMGSVLYLASRESSYTTGSVVVVDGGWTAV